LELERREGEGDEDNNMSSNNDGNGRSSSSATLNMKKGYAGHLLEDLVHEVMKDDGRKEKIRQKRQQEEEVANTAKRLKEMTKVSSGGLSSHGMYQIVPDVHNEIRTRKAHGKPVSWHGAKFAVRTDPEQFYGTYKARAK
jgi:hypothetical protein